MTSSNHSNPNSGETEAQSPGRTSVTRITPRRIVRRIFDSDNPAIATQRLTPYSLYSLVLHLGFDEGSELLTIASREQLGRVFDFHCWAGSEFQEDRFIELLASTDAAESLDLLQRMIASMDLKLLALMISRHVAVEIFEEPTETPPEDGYYTPDRGYTWLKVDDQNESLYFQLSRALALVFENSAELFYQLIAIPNVHTPSMLEEEAASEKVKNIEGLGFPSSTCCQELMTPLHPAEALGRVGLSVKETFQTQEPEPAHTKVPDIAEASYSGLQSLRSLCSDENEFNAEIQLLINAAILHWSVPFSDPPLLRRTTERVLATIEIGTEWAETQSPIGALYPTLSLTNFFQIGLWQYRRLSKVAWKVRNSITLDDLNAQLSQLLHSTCDPLPGIPSWWHLGWRNDVTNTSPENYSERLLVSLTELEHLINNLPKYFDCSGL